MGISGLVQENKSERLEEELSSLCCCIHLRAYAAAWGGIRPSTVGQHGQLRL